MDWASLRFIALCKYSIYLKAARNKFLPIFVQKEKYLVASLSKLTIPSEMDTAREWGTSVVGGGEEKGIQFQQED
jgi:hypothetical protein